MRASFFEVASRRAIRRTDRWQVVGPKLQEFS